MMIMKPVFIPAFLIKGHFIQFKLIDISHVFIVVFKYLKIFLLPYLNILLYIYNILLDIIYKSKF